MGRNNEESYCILLHKENINDTAKKRLNIMTETNNGFLIAEEDLKIRGAWRNARQKTIRITIF